MPGGMGLRSGRPMDNIGGLPFPGAMNKLYYGNNLDVLRDSIATESVDLIYLNLPQLQMLNHISHG